MATHATRHAPTESSLPLYRMDSATYARLTRAGALDGLDVELRGGLIVERSGPRAGMLHLLDTKTYNRMVATGALDEEPLELLEGLLVAVTRQGPEHAEAIMRLTRHLGAARAWLRVQLPLEIGLRSEPEPDLGLQEGPGSATEHPHTLLLAVEVSVTSHYKDRNHRATLYAQAGVPIYWLVDVPGRAVEVRTEPGARGYERCDIYKPGEHVPSPAEGVPDLDVAQLFAELGDA